jgi:effector-binding domain-containing protein
MLDKPQIIEAEARNTAVIHLTVPRDQIESVMDPAINEVLDVIKAQGVCPIGPLFSYHRKRPSDMFDFEVGVPVANPVHAAGRVKPGHLPAAKVARTVYHGGYEDLGEAWGAFITWIQENGYTQREDLWECYLSGPESSQDPATYRTELNRPLQV